MHAACCAKRDLLQLAYSGRGNDGGGAAANDQVSGGGSVSDDDVNIAAVYGKRAKISL